jgi:hypothetical protein
MSKHTISFEVLRTLTVTGRVTRDEVEILSASIEGRPVTLSDAEKFDACEALGMAFWKAQDEDKRAAEMDAAEARL